jgi:hypothetical protein
MRARRGNGLKQVKLKMEPLWFLKLRAKKERAQVATERTNERVGAADAGEKPTKHGGIWCEREGARPARGATPDWTARAVPGK